SLVEQLGDQLGRPNPILRAPKLLETMGVAFLLLALLGPVYPFSLNQIQRGGLQIMFVVDLSQSMEEPIPGASSSPPGPPGVTRVVPSGPSMSVAGSLLATPGS